MKLYTPDNKKESKTKSCISCIITLLIIISIIYLIEKLLFMLCCLIVRFSILGIILQIILHLLVIRNIVYNILFIGQFGFLSRQYVHLFGEAQAKYIYKYLSSLFKSLVYLTEKNTNKNYDKLIEIKKDTQKCINLINSYITTFSKMKSKFQLSNNQNIFFQNLIDFSNKIENNKLIENLSSIIETNSYTSNQFKFSLETQESFEKLFEELYYPIQKLLDILANFMNIVNPWYSYKRYKSIFFDDTLGSLNQYHIEMSNDFELEEKKLKVSDGNIIDYIIIKSNDNPQLQNIKKNLIIICGPNGSSYQFFCKNIRLDNYLKQGIDVICWNYRGYGFSSGYVTINNIKSDIIDLYNEILSWNKYGKIGVHGISVGGIPACYLANNVKDICLLVSDRNFGQVDYIVLEYNLGFFLFYFYKLIFMPNTYTINDFINAKCYKVILNDPNDDIVKDCASLKTLTSKYIVKKYLYRDNKYNVDSSNGINDYNNLNNNNYKYENCCGLELLLDNKDDVLKFKKCLCELCEEFISDEFEIKKKKSLFQKLNIFNFFSKEENPLYSRLQEDNIYDSKTIDFIRQNLQIFFDNFESAGDILTHIFKYNDERRKNIFIDNFINNFLIYGIKCIDQNEGFIHFFSTEEREKIINSEIECLNNILNSESIKLTSKKKNIIKNINSIQNYLKQFLKNLKLISIQENILYPNIELGLIQNENLDNLDTINTEKLDIENENLKLKNNMSNEFEKKLIKLGKGNLITLKCGHNSPLYYDELFTLCVHLEKSGILDFYPL